MYSRSREASKDQKNERTNLPDSISCDVGDLRDGSMKEVDVCDNKKILLIKDNGNYYALSSKCSHYGAPLSKGVLCSGRVRCPWHGACFSFVTGDIEDFPGGDSLNTFPVTVRENKAIINYNNDDFQTKRSTVDNCLVNNNAKASQSFLVIGGGAVAAIFVETLRSNGFCGSVTVATREKYLPYDKPKMSKSLSSTAESLALRTAEDYSKLQVEFRFNCEAISVDLRRKRVEFNNTEALHYDKLLICTGGTPKILNIPGADLENIKTLRSVDDANEIAAKAKTKNIVIIGQSFIGLEVASYLADKAASVTVIGRSSTPLKNLLGEKVGTVIKRMLESKNVKFVFESQPIKYVGKNGKIEAVLLANGEQILCDFCVVGIGVKPATDFLKNSGLKMSPDGYLVVSKHMRTSDDNVFAGGDIVKFPLFMRQDEIVNVQHWQMSCKHGQIAGLNACGIIKEIKSVPFFWTVILGKSIRYCGYAPDYDDIIIHGDVDSQKFVSFYTRKDELLAVASMNFDPVVAQAAEVFYSGLAISATELRKSIDDVLEKFSRLSIGRE